MVQRRKRQARITKTSEPNKERLITRDVSVEPELPDTERTEGATKSSRIEKSAPPKRNYSTSRARHPRRMTDASSREVPVWHRGCVATFKKRRESDGLGRPDSVSCIHLEQLVDELNLLPNIRTVHPPRLPLPDHMHGLVSLDRSPRHVEFTKALLGLQRGTARLLCAVSDQSVRDRSSGSGARVILGNTGQHNRSTIGEFGHQRQGSTHRLYRLPKCGQQ